MTSAFRLNVLDSPQRNSIEMLLMKFEETWNPSRLEDYSEQLKASQNDETYRRVALAELVKIDMDRQWSAGNKRYVEDYLRRFQVLESDGAPDADLILVEFYARRTNDEEATVESYRSRFPRRFEEFQRLVVEQLNSDVTHAAKQPSNSVSQASIDTSRVAGRETSVEDRVHQDLDDLPAQFGRYRIERRIGAGAMGTVYLAHDCQLDRLVALKTPSFRESDSDDLVGRFYREARSAAKIHHPNICPVYDVGEIDGRHFISMAFVKGRCMSEYIRPKKLPPPHTSAILVLRLALALEQAHLQNVIHRDLKPANIMINENKEPIVMDFGLARDLDGESRMTRSGMAVGTPAYMSPEQVRGAQDEIGPTVDIYSLGVIFYELLTGRLPFQGGIAHVVYCIVHEEPTAPSNLRSKIDPMLEEICLKMMAKRCEERFQSMQEVADELKAYVKAGKTKNTTENAADETRARTSASETSTVTETGVLNEFFATQASQMSATPATVKNSIARRHRSESNRVRKPARKTNPKRQRVPRNLLIAGGLFAIAIFAGVIIYFSDGSRIEIDDGTQASIQVGADGRIQGIDTRPSSAVQRKAARTTSQTESDSSQDQSRAEEADATKSDPGVSSEAASLAASSARSDPNNTLNAAVDNQGDSVVGAEPNTIDREAMASPNDSVNIGSTSIGRNARSGTSPLDALDPKSLTQQMRAAGLVDFDQPIPELVAVFGDGHLMHWNEIFPCGLDFSPDNRSIVAACLDGTLVVWDKQSGEQKEVMHCPYGPAVSVAWHPTNSNRIFATSTRSSVYEVDIRSGQWRPLYENANDAVVRSSLAVSPNGEWLVAGGYNVVDVFHLPSDKRVHELKMSPSVRGVAISSDSQMVAAASASSVVSVWELRSGKVVDSLKGSRGEFHNGVAFAPGQSKVTVAMCNGGKKRSLVRNWNLGEDDWSRYLPANDGGFAWSVHYSPDGKWLAQGGEKTSVDIWSTEDWSNHVKLRTVEDLRFLDVGKRVVRFSRDSKTLATAGSDNAIHLWDLAAKRFAKRPLYGHLHSVAIDRAGERIAFIGDGGVIGAVDLTNQKVQHARVSNSPARSIAFSSDDGLLAAASADGNVYVRDSKTLESPTASPGLLKGDDKRQMLACAFHPTESLISVGSNSDRVVTADWSDRKFAPRYSLQKTYVSSGRSSNRGVRDQTLAIDYSDDGQLVAYAGSEGYSRHCRGMVHVCDANTGATIKSIPFEHSIYSVAFHPDTKRLAVVGIESVVADSKQMTAGEKRLVAMVDLDGNRILDMSLPVNSAEFSHDGTQMVLAGSDGIVRVVDVQSHRVVKEIRIGPKWGDVEHAIFGPHDRHIITANANGTVFVLRLEP